MGIDAKAKAARPATVAFPNPSRYRPIVAIFAALKDYLADGPLSGLAERWSAFRHDRAGVAFTIAVIALAAKMARADGVATEAEFQTFQRLFNVPPAERANAARFYNLAKTSTSGFEAYADQAAQALGPGSPLAEDLVAALMEIALTDGLTGPEIRYLEEVASRLGLSQQALDCVKRRYLGLGDCRPSAVLGVAPDASVSEIKSAYRTLVKRHHPDRHIADGMPSEFVRLAEIRMAAINDAYAVLMRARAAG